MLDDKMIYVFKSIGLMEGSYNDRTSATPLPTHFIGDTIIDDKLNSVPKISEMKGKYGLNVCLDVMTHTSDWGHEIKWKIKGTSTMASCESNTEYENGQIYTQNCCLPVKEDEFDLTCIDSFGDGWHGAHLEIDGKSYCKNLKGDHMTVIVPNPAKKECGASKNTKKCSTFVLQFNLS